MASLRDIAAEAEVSIRTVSRALKGTGYVGGEARRKVLEAAERLGYRPNLAARRLRTGLSMEIGVIAGSTDQLHMAKLAAFEAELRQAGYGVFVIFTGPGGSGSADSLLDRQPAACAVLSGLGEQTGPAVERLRGADLPLVLIDVRSPTCPADAIGIDRQQGVYEACLHLAKTGRRRIAYIGPVTDSTRLAGYGRAMDEVGQAHIIVAVDGTAEEEIKGYRAADRLLSLAPTPDAVQVYSDVMAASVLRRLHELGRRVPEEVAVVGFDDRPVAGLTWPTLTTVAQPNAEAGRQAARMLLAKIAGEDAPPGGWTQNLPTRLVVREST